MSFSGRYSFKNLFQNSICLLYPGDVSNILLLQLICVINGYIAFLLPVIVLISSCVLFPLIVRMSLMHYLVHFSDMHVLYCHLLKYMDIAGI